MTLTIRTFFFNLKNMGRIIKYNSKKLNKQSKILLKNDVAFVDILMNSIKDSTVKAYSLNIYNIEMAKFYREIMQRGLLSKIRGLRFEKRPKEEVENLQKFILAECIATQQLIKEKVRSVFYYILYF